jgi:uncharacterized protein YceK
MKPVMLVGLLLVLLASIGCGTLYNLDFNTCCCGGRPDSNRIYGGVEAELAFAVRNLREITTPDTPISTQIFGVTFVSVLTILDLPLSIVGDTVTLPLTIAAQIGRYMQSEPKQASTETSESAAKQATN